MKTTLARPQLAEASLLAGDYANLQVIQPITRYNKGKVLTIASLGRRIAWPIIYLPLSAAKRGRASGEARIYVTIRGELVGMHVSRLGQILHRNPCRPLRLEQLPSASLSKLIWKLKEQIDEIENDSSF